MGYFLQPRPHRPQDQHCEAKQQADDDGPSPSEDHTLGGRPRLVRVLLPGVFHQKESQQREGDAQQGGEKETAEGAGDEGHEQRAPPGAGFAGVAQHQDVVRQQGEDRQQGDGGEVESAARFEAGEEPVDQGEDPHHRRGREGRNDHRDPGDQEHDQGADAQCEIEPRYHESLLLKPNAALASPALSPGYEVDDADVRVVGHLDVSIGILRDEVAVNGHHDVGIRVRHRVEQILDGHPPPPRNLIPAVDGDHPPLSPSR